MINIFRIKIKLIVFEPILARRLNTLDNLASSASSKSSYITLYVIALSKDL